jgi:hypothetical protein
MVIGTEAQSSGHGPAGSGSVRAMRGIALDIRNVANDTAAVRCTTTAPVRRGLDHAMRAVSGTG